MRRRDVNGRVVVVPSARHNRQPIVVRPGRQVDDEWERRGRAHFICRAAFEAHRKPQPASARLPATWRDALLQLFAGQRATKEAG